MHFSEYLVWLRKRGLQHFTLKRASEELGKSEVAIKNAVERRKIHGDIISPARGLYVIVPPEHQLRGSIPAEELVPIITEYLGIEYYVSLLSGAAYHGATHQKPGRFQIVTTKRIKHSLVFGLTAIEVIHKESIRDLPIEDVAVDTGYLRVASVELVIYDLMQYPRRVGGLNHIATVLSELIEAVDVNKLIALGKQIGNKAIIQRLGYILYHFPFLNDPNEFFGSR